MCLSPLLLFMMQRVKSIIQSLPILTIRPIFHHGRPFPLHQAKRTQTSPIISLMNRSAKGYTYSVQNSAHSQEDSRKLLQISQSIIPTLLQKNDIASVAELIHQMAQTVVTQLMYSDRKESKKVLTFVYQLVGELWHHFSANQLESLERTLKMLTGSIDGINDTELIEGTHEIYVKIIEKKDGKNNTAYLQALSQLAENCIHADLIDRALQCLKDVQGICEKQSIPINPQTNIQNYLNLGIIYLSKGDNQASIDAYTQALSLAKQDSTSSHMLVAIYECLGDAYKNNCQIEQSLECYQESLKASRTCFAEIDINTIILMYKTANQFCLLHRYQDAVSLCQQIEKYLEDDAGLLEEFEYYEEMLVLMGESQGKLGNITSAVQHYEKYIIHAEKHIIIKQKLYTLTINRLIDLHLQQGNHQQALKHLKSLTKYYKIQGNQSSKQQCEQRSRQIESSLKN